MAKNKSDLIEDLEHLQAFLAMVQKSAEAQSDKFDPIIEPGSYMYQRGRKDLAEGLSKKLDKVLKGAK